MGNNPDVAQVPASSGPDEQQLRSAIQEEYRTVAQEPDRGFHFHTGRPLASILAYREEWMEGIPERSVESFAGTGNPFKLGPVNPGDRIVDVGCGSGFDSLIAAKFAGPEGKVIGVDMTEEMLAKARRSSEEMELANVEFRLGYAEDLPVEDEFADVIISNGVLNLVPDKPEAVNEFFRVLKPGGRIQFGDISVDREVPESAKEDIDLWTG